VDHPRRIEEVIVLRKKGCSSADGVNSALFHTPTGRPAASIDGGVAVDDAGLREAIEHLHLAADAARQAEVIIAEHGHQLSAALRGERVVGRCDPQIALTTDDSA
jgi:hypothetical protein